MVASKSKSDGHGPNRQSGLKNSSQAWMVVDLARFIRRKVEKEKSHEIHVTDLSRGTGLGRSY